MSKNLTIVEITEYELDQLHADLDNAGNELFLQEGKIKELEAKNIELEKKLEIAKDTLERLDKITVLAESAKYIIKEALAAINGEGV